MTGFSPDWLALRADADARARDPGLVAALDAHFAGRPIAVIDIGAGTGANLRATAPRLSAPQSWLLVDNDAALLGRANGPAGVVVETLVADLAEELEDLFDPAPDLVTASAFFDLCGEEWIQRLVAAIWATGAAFYTNLTYDGRETWAPPHPDDAAVLAAFHADQRRDKGLGAALGPDTHAALAQAFRAAGYRVSEAASDWQLTAPRDAELIAALAAGTAGAVTPALGPAATEWGRARGQATSVMIGHRDLLALPPL